MTRMERYRAVESAVFTFFRRLWHWILMPLMVATVIGILFGFIGIFIAMIWIPSEQIHRLWLLFPVPFLFLILVLLGTLPDALTELDKEDER